MDSNLYRTELEGSELFKRIREWAERLADEGFISQQTVENLVLAPTLKPSDLFGDLGRPLVVAFFGGTGVGKSTLLNRLAGCEVAKTGIERPTSREVTLYLPDGVKLKQLPPGLPLAKIKTVFHQNLNRKEIAWIDLPDIDSIEHANRELACCLMPYIDVMVYVVSPERYRDDAGWRLLMERSLSSAWLFVMNHWDEGCEGQIEDFVHQLETAGFSDPIVLRCDSRPEILARKPDDFGKLEEILKDFTRAHGVERLTLRNEHLRFEQLKDQVNALLDALGEEARIDRLCKTWREIWKETVQVLSPALNGQSSALAREAAQLGAGSDWIQTLLDTWTQQLMLDALDRLVLEAETIGFKPEPIRRCLAPYRSELLKDLEHQVQRSLRQSLATPGHWFQRRLALGFGALKYLLPLLASGLAGYQLVHGYFLKVYLGIDFAVHSLLLIGLAWLIPHLVHRLLEPSLERAARRGVQCGLALGFERIEAEVERHLRSLSQRLAEMTLEGRRLAKALTPLPFSPKASGKSAIDRMLAASP